MRRAGLPTEHEAYSVWFIAGIGLFRSLGKQIILITGTFGIDDD